MKALAVIVWIILLGLLTWGFRSIVVFGVEMLLIGLLVWRKPEWFEK